MCLIAAKDTNTQEFSASSVTPTHCLLVLCCCIPLPLTPSHRVADANSVTLQYPADLWRTFILRCRKRFSALLSGQSSNVHFFSAFHCLLLKGECVLLSGDFNFSTNKHLCATPLCCNFTTPSSRLRAIVKTTRICRSVPVVASLR